MAITSKSKIRAAMSVVALAMYMGLDEEMLHTKAAIVEPVTATVKETKVKACENVVTVKYGNVKPESVERAKELLVHYLDPNVTVDNMVVVEGNDVESFTGNKLKIPHSKLREGQKIADSDKVNIYIAEGQIEEYMPAIAMSLNQYFNGKNYKAEVTIV